MCEIYNAADHRGLFAKVGLTSATTRGQLHSNRVLGALLNPKLGETGVGAVQGVHLATVSQLVHRLHCETRERLIQIELDDCGGMRWSEGLDARADGEGADLPGKYQSWLASSHSPSNSIPASPDLHSPPQAFDPREDDRMDIVSIQELHSVDDGRSPVDPFREPSIQHDDEMFGFSDNTTTVTPTSDRKQARSHRHQFDFDADSWADPKIDSPLDSAPRTHGDASPTIPTIPTRHENPDEADRDAVDAPLNQDVIDDPDALLYYDELSGFIDGPLRTESTVDASPAVDCGGMDSVTPCSGTPPTDDISDGQKIEEPANAVAIAQHHVLHHLTSAPAEVDDSSAATGRFNWHSVASVAQALHATEQITVEMVDPPPLIAKGMAVRTLDPKPSGKKKVCICMEIHSHSSTLCATWPCFHR